MTSNESIVTDISDPRVERIIAAASGYFAIGVEVTARYDSSANRSLATIDSGSYTGREVEMLPATENPDSHYFVKTEASPF